MFKKSSNKKKDAACTVCSATDIIVGIFAVVISLVALAGVYMSHVRADGIVLGDVHGASSIIAFVLSLFLVRKACRSCCGCGC